MELPGPIGAGAVKVETVKSDDLLQGLKTMLVLSTALGGVTALGGMYLSYYVDIASGASIVLCAALLFVAVLGVRRGTTYRPWLLRPPAGRSRGYCSNGGGWWRIGLALGGGVDGC